MERESLWSFCSELLFSQKFFQYFLYASSLFLILNSLYIISAISCHVRLYSFLLLHNLNLNSENVSSLLLNLYEVILSKSILLSLLFLFTLIFIYSFTLFIYKTTEDYFCIIVFRSVIY